MFKPYGNMFAGYSTNDGTIDFYGRIKTLASPQRVLVDLGAGRGEWLNDDIQPRKECRLMLGKFERVIALDVDPVVLENSSADECFVIENGKLPLKSNSVDVIVCDYVLEHVEEPQTFVAEVDRVLKRGGWFCARTPHKYSYIALSSRLLGERLGSRLLSAAQPNREEKDIFRKHYKLNTLTEIRRQFPEYDSKSFLFRADPSYFFDSALVYSIQSFAHRVLPVVLTANIFIFLCKPQNVDGTRTVVT